MSQLSTLPPVTSAAETPHWTARHGKPIIFVILTMVAVGVYLALTIPVAVFPSTDFPRIVVAAPTPGLADPHMDEKIIHRPPQGTFAQQQPRTPLAGNLYPGLQLLPVETARLEPIPVYFPRVKVEPIPINALNARMIPVLTVKQSTAPKR